MKTLIITANFSNLSVRCCSFFIIQVNGSELDLRERGNLQMMLISRFYTFQKQNRELSLERSEGASRSYQEKTSRRLVPISGQNVFVMITFINVTDWDFTML
jgi:hypothetical protein